MIEKILYNSETLALIVRSGFEKNGIEFFTPSSFSQQLGYMKRPKGYVVTPHVHKPVSREIFYTKEVLFIKKGKLRFDFYDKEQKYLESKILKKGDIILLAFGGHGIEVLEEAEMIEVKQGPYAGEMDKGRFKPVDKSKIVFKD